MLEHRSDERAPAALPAQVGPHPVADVDRAVLLLDAGHPGFEADAAEADQVPVLLDREEAAAAPERPDGVIGRVATRIAPAERTLGLGGGQLAGPHVRVSRAASRTSRAGAARRARRAGCAATGR